MTTTGFKYALNASTLFPFGLGIAEQLRVAAEAGYEGIEIWVRDLEAYLAGGGTTAGLESLSSDLGIAIVNGIAFFPWTAGDAGIRESGLEQAKREIGLLAEVGCTGVAAPPSGDVAGVGLEDVAVNFGELAGISRGLGVEPYLEFWGRSSLLSRLDQAVYVGMRSGVPSAKVLLDLFHMYTGGSRLETVPMLSGDSIGIVHVNDYPGEPGVGTITDADRVFPGDGIGPSTRFAEILRSVGYTGYLSLELFIKDFKGASALDVAKLGLEKVKAVYA